MAKESKIEWTEATWNPWYGCHKVSQGCKNCYMFRDTPRFGKDPNTVVRSKTTFNDPLKWREPRRIFTCSWSDFFIEEADPWRDEAFAIMALTPHHTYQVLTKRPERMLEYFNYPKVAGHIAMHAMRLRKEWNITFPNAEFQTEPLGYGDPGAEWFPLRNVWLGVSVEDQKTADERIPLLLDASAAVRWLSIEPLLGPIDLVEYPGENDFDTREAREWDWLGHRFVLDEAVKADAIEDGLVYTEFCKECQNRFGNPMHNNRPRLPHIKGYCPDMTFIDWVVAGGESGPDARPMHPDWLRSIRDQCTAANVPFFFKQWGEWAPAPDWDGEVRNCENVIKKGSEGQTVTPTNKFEYLRRVGKKVAGRILDARTWDEIPEVSR